MVRRAIVVLAVAAVVLGVLAWRRDGGVDLRRLACPDGVGSRLPPRGAARSAGAPEVALAPVAELDQPIGLATRPGDDALYFVQKEGRLVRLREGAVTTVVDLGGEVSTASEQGLLGLAFSPDGERLYTNHTDLEGHTRLTEWTVGDGAARDRREVLFVEQPDRWHNGGSLAFGPDGMLYAGLGDGGGEDDPRDNGQSLGTLLGKVLRIDPRPDGDRPYTVPPDNPFVGRKGARPEIWAYGLRNPWRLSFDAGTGDLWIGDVGLGCFEEIDLERSGGGGGANYGWDRTEGHWLYDPPAPAGYVEPVYSYRRDGRETCAVVGGQVYRGSAVPELRGWYVFGDLCHGQLMAWQGPGRGEPLALGHTVDALVSFGVDQAGELYALSLAGGVSRVVPAAPGAP
ncbi:MAG: PQQ-dependent sugar dehydrogenase [Acidimicrobiia bacterium]